MTERSHNFGARWILGAAVIVASAMAFASYKARPWAIRARDSYPSILTSEGITIAVDPLFTDALAARVFDKNDIVTRGIMPLAIVIFNDNNFAINVDGAAIELIQGDEHFRTLPVNDVIHRLFQKSGRKFWIPQAPRMPTVDKGDPDALDDFEHKYLNNKLIGGQGKGGGFLYLQVPESEDAGGYLRKARVYIPEIYRQDTGAKMIFFEIDLKPAIDAFAAK